MKIEPPLSNLITRCQTICVAECCGVDAYDFSPVQIASYLTMWRGAPDPEEIARLQEQVAMLRANYGIGGKSDSGITIDEMNQSFTAEEIDALTAEIVANLEVALDLVAASESRRFKNEKRA